MEGRKGERWEGSLILSYLHKMVFVLQKATFSRKFNNLSHFPYCGVYMQRVYFDPNLR